MKTILLAAGMSLLASAAPALAQDAAAPAESPSFTGGRVEFFGGWDRADVRSRFDGVGAKTHRDGITGGVLAGYDFPIGDHLVAGPFGSYALTSTKDCDLGGCLKSDRQIEGGARVGYKFGDRMMAYAKGAYVNGRFDAHLLNADDTQYLVGHTNRDGWRAGGGLEYALNRHTYVKAEYDYTRFKSFDAGAFADTDVSDVRVDRNEVLGGFGVRF